MRTPLEPPTPAQIAWAAGYRAGFYPDDFEPIPDVLDGLTEWIEGYYSGCSSREKIQRRYRQFAILRLRPKRQRESPLIGCILAQHMPQGAPDFDNAGECGTLPSDVCSSK